MNLFLSADGVNCDYFRLDWYILASHVQIAQMPTHEFCGNQIDHTGDSSVIYGVTVEILAGIGILASLNQSNAFETDNEFNFCGRTDNL